MHNSIYGSDGIGGGMGITKSSAASRQAINMAVANVINAADETNVITVGNVLVSDVTYANGGAIDALSADAWTDIQDINLGKPFVFQIRYTVNGFSYIDMKAETVGDYLRAQYEIDGIVVLDYTVGPNKSQVVSFLNTDHVQTANSFPFYANSRFRVRLYKHGTIDQAGSTASFGAILYAEVN